MEQLKNLLNLKKSLEKSALLSQEAFQENKKTADMIIQQIRNFIDPDVQILSDRINGEYAQDTDKSPLVVRWKFVEQEELEVLRIRFICHPYLDVNHAKTLFQDIIQREEVKKTVKLLNQRHGIKFSIDSNLEFS